MEVPGEVEVDLLHREYLGIASARSTTLEAEAGAKGRLAKGYHSLLA